MRRILALGLLLLAAGAAPAKTNVTELNKVVAVVNDDVVTAGEVADRASYVEKQLKQNGTAMPPRDVLEKQVLERLIIERIELQMAENFGLRVEEDAIDQVINNIAKDRKLTLDQLRATLARDGMSYTDFRRSIRNELLMQRLRGRQVVNRISVTPQEVADYLAGGNQDDREFHLSHILIGLPEAATPEQVQSARTEAEQVLAQVHLGADFSQLAVAHSRAQEALEGGELGWRRIGQLPSLFADAIKSLKPGQVTELIRSPAGFHILKVTGVRGEEQHVVRQTHARHILIRPNDILSSEEARQKLERLRQRILAGEDFATLARANSDDKGSGSQGGDLGWANPGQFVPEFEKALNDTPLGKVSQPFQTNYGWHIVQPLERRDYDNTDEYRRNRAAEAIRQRKIEEETDSWLRQIRDEAFVEYK